MNSWRGHLWPAAALCLSGSLGAVCALTAQEATPTEAPSDQDPIVALKLDTFVVTGSLIKRTDFEGPSPLRVITRADIEQVAGTGLADVLREMPEAGGIGGYTGVNESATTTSGRTASALDLRSLGPQNTLILVDGRRQAPNGISAGDDTTFVDLNRFPLAMIERVEVLKDGAAAVYGADATAGVVNIILRKDYKGVELAGSYGNYTRTDAGELSWSLLAGGRKGRFHGMLGLTYSSHHAIAAIDLPISANADKTEIWRAVDPVKYADQLEPTSTGTSFFDARTLKGPYATVAVPTEVMLTNPHNGLTLEDIRNPLTGNISFFLPGTGGVPQGTLGSSKKPASVPREGNPGQPTAAEFIVTGYPAGPYSNSFNNQPFVWNTPEVERQGLTANFGFDLTPTTNFFAALGAMRLISRSQLAPPPISTSGDNAILVPATNYYNPFGIPVAFTFRETGVGPRIFHVASDSYSALAGLQGTLHQRYDWTFGWAYSHNKNTDTEDDLSESSVRAALAKTTPDALNIFGGPDFRNDPATLESLKIKTERSGDASTELADFHLTTSDLFALPWGVVGASASVEDRWETYNITNDPQSSVYDDVIATSPANGPTHSNREVRSVAAELRLPLVRENRSSWLRSAELSAAARYESFSDGYNSGVEPWVGLRLRITDHLLLRASYGQVFRAPSLPQLFGGPVDSYAANLEDRRRPEALTGDPEDSASAQRLVRKGGNPFLLPETGTTRQCGLVFDVPGRLFRGLSFEFTYGVIDQDNDIVQVDPDFILDNELGGTGPLVSRETGTETYTNMTSDPIPVLTGPAGATTDVQPGQTVSVPGHMTMILNALVNLSNQSIRYYDFGLRYRLPTERFGRFTFSSNWTFNEYYAFNYLPTDEPFNSVGHDVPRYRGQGSLMWERHRWSAYLNMNYLTHYRTQDVEGWEVARYYTFAAGVSYTFADKFFLPGLQLSLGVDNLLDRAPSPDLNSSGYDQSNIGRPAGRYWFVAFRQEF